MAVLNLSAMFWPHIFSPYYGILLAAVLVVNLMVALAVLRGVEPVSDADDDERLTTFAKKWMRWLSYSSPYFVLILGLGGWLDRQFIPFLVCGYAFLWAMSRVLDVSLYKWMDERS